MGRNKQIRKVIVSLEHQIRIHEKKIPAELSKPFPNDEHIAGWQREIEVWKRQIERLGRRLRRNW